MKTKYILIINAIFFLMASLMISGCGQKGPLYMPKQEQTKHTLTKSMQCLVRNHDMVVVINNQLF